MANPTQEPLLKQAMSVLPSLATEMEKGAPSSPLRVARYDLPKYGGGSLDSSKALKMVAVRAEHRVGDRKSVV